MTICFGAKVLSVVEVHRKTYVSGIGPEAIFESHPIGWKVSLDDHTSTIFAAKPDLEPDQEIWIIWEPRNGEPTQQPPVQSARQLPPGDVSVEPGDGEPTVSSPRSDQPAPLPAAALSGALGFGV